MGFTNVLACKDKVVWEGITFHLSAGRHGTSQAVLSDMGEVAGFVFKAEGEPTLYWAGDTVWYDGISAALEQFEPDVVIVHACGALWSDELIVMDAAQVIEVCRAAPQATIVATHMEALDHATLSRKALRCTTHDAGITEKQLLIPSDGEHIKDLGTV